MSHLRCACLVVIKNQQLLLVRARNNKKWYFPGGKIENNETAEQALIREVREELSVEIKVDSITYLTTVIGPAYGRDGLVELICFAANWHGDIAPASEISEIGYLDYQQRELLAPAVALFFEQWFNLSVPTLNSER